MKLPQVRHAARLLALLGVLTGCAAGDEGTTTSTGTGAGGGGGATTGPGAGGAGGDGGQTGAGGAGGGGGQGGQGGGLSGEVELCVLNEGEPYDPCLQPEQLDYGSVSAGTTELRTFRIDNQTLDDLLFTSVDVASNKFTVQAVRFEQDPGDPGNYLRVEVDLPVTRPSEGALWFEVSYAAGGSAAPLPSVDVVVKMNQNAQPIADVVVPVVGNETGCGVGTAACDADPTNGCETNTQTSLDHCGGCNQPCAPANGTGQCVDGQCELTGCTLPAADCNDNDADGCESSLLSDVNNCGVCGLSCMKANTDSFCNGGNCNVIGCQNNHADCNLSAADGCETNLANSMAHCGGCNLPCALANASESCVPSLVTGLGVCTLGTCDTGFANCNNLPGDGCEVNTTNDVNHCGQCFDDCSFPNAGASCVNSGCVMGACATDYANCDNLAVTGCEINYKTNKDHCGACGNDCDTLLPNSQTTCSNYTCGSTGCLPNYWDLSPIAPGCEYFCVQQGGPDLPDDGFADTNCDGIDGDASAAVFVATGGSDSNSGTREFPMATINGGIQRALTTSKTQVYVSSGTYVGRVTLASGVSIYGGYSASNNWQRSAGFVTTISTSAVSGGRVTALDGANILTPTTVDRLTILTGNTSSAGTSNYAVYCDECDALTIKNSVIDAGNAGNGSAGGAGSTGSSGGDGTAGTGGSCDGNGSGGPGGPGAGSTCGRAGGAGGRGGSIGVSGESRDGVGGSTGQIGTSGGSGGAYGDPGAAGVKGSDGTSGSNGGGGSAGSGGSVLSKLWQSAVGGTGFAGAAGNGGGGGGGGGAQSCTLCNDGRGNGGGGGGAGGCGGSGGLGGTGGGGSFGVFLVNSTGIQLVGNTISSGNGGAGGSGGNGGGGGLGGGGGAGAAVCTGEIRAGGAGGVGGNGGTGGGGGGGAGGPSYAVYRSGTTVTLTGNSLSAGSGGSGGSGGLPSGNAGGTGASANFN